VAAAEIAAVTAAPVPAGTDAALWRSLTTQLARQLTERGASAANKPLTDSQFTVQDFALAGRDASSQSATWTLRNPGDYDQNGEVNLGDLTLVAKYNQHTAASPDWGQAQIADGNGNGQVEIGDVTVIGKNFKNVLTGYYLMVEWDDFDGNGERNIVDITPLTQLGPQLSFTPNFGGAGGVVLTLPGDPDQLVLGTDPATDLPGPWFPMCQVDVAAGIIPAGGGLRRFTAVIQVHNGSRDLTGQRIAVVPYFRPDPSAAGVGAGNRSAYLQVAAFP
jgi:hypothetical protein